MKANDMRGLSQDLNQGTRYNRRHGGVSDTLKRIKKRPENKDWRLNALHNRNTQSKCDECEATATISSFKNSELEYRLCSACFKKRIEAKKNKKLKL